MRGGFRNKRQRRPVRLIAAGAALVVFAAAVLWFAHVADTRPVPQREIREEATNVHRE